LGVGIFLRGGGIFSGRWLVGRLFTLCYLRAVRVGG
jgi:hypothetical protein